MVNRREVSPNEWFRSLLSVVAICLICSMAVLSINCFGTGASVNTTLKKIDVTKGICVVLGDSKCSISLGLAKKSDLLIYIQLPTDKDVETARFIADNAGLYGKRIFIEKGELSHIHLADNIADALIIVGDETSVPEDEALRVIHPEGKVIIGQREIVKSFPEGVDDWSHPYHSPDNSLQSKDQIARAPYLTHFLSDPRYGPLPQVAVASAGRLFKAYGHIAFKEREEPLLNTLVAYNGYNGTELWKHELVPGIMIHRDTMIATPTALYMGDDKSCKVFDAKTGELKDEIVVPKELAGGTFWKWMALEDGILYAIVGEDEQRDPVVKLGSNTHGWPWNPLSPGYNQEMNPWGFGKAVFAIDIKTKNVLWNHQEEIPIDSRAVCMKNGKLFIFRFGEYLSCLDTKTGAEIWRKSKGKNPEIFKILGEDLNRQDWQTNWRTTNYLKCTDKALYFAGPMISKLLAVSTDDGSVLWENPFNNFQLILNDNGLYGISGGVWGDNVSRKFDLMTGKILGKYNMGRRACARPTGAVDAIFFRAMGGSIRFDLTSEKLQYMSPMRPQCQDGVVISNGLLYWTPQPCDCQLSLYGLVSVGPAGNFDLSSTAVGEERLEKGLGDITKVSSLDISQADWPTFRANNQCTATTEALVSEKGGLLWTYAPNSKSTLTAPVTAGGMMFISGADGIVRAIETTSGKQQWSSYTGGGVRISPTVWNGRVYIGSGDGWVYTFEAATGRLLWRFRAAPAERKIPVYGSLLSTWPASSGVLVDDGTAYVAAGIVNFDGTHVYALDAETGSVKWQNNISGHLLHPTAMSGVSVQGHMLLHNKKLYLAGGNAISPGIYDIADGKCLNKADSLHRCESIALRGWELSLIGDSVVPCGQPFYKDPRSMVYDPSVFEKFYHTSVGDRDIVWESDHRAEKRTAGEPQGMKVVCYPSICRDTLTKSVTEREYPGQYIIPTWGNIDVSAAPLWEYNCQGSVALAICKNAVVVAETSGIVVLNLKDGSVAWKEPLPSSPVEWGLAVDRDGRVIVTLENGEVMCFGKGS